MRISTGMLYEAGLAGIQQRQQQGLGLQQQIASGRRMLTPSDDPIAAATALDVSQAQSLNRQYGVNADSARAALTLEEQALADVTRLLQDVKVLAVNAGNPTLNNDNRASLAAEVEGRYRELLGIANRTDGSGRYLFSGYQGATQPFSESSPGVVAYLGDQGRREIQIGAARMIAVSDPGSDVFNRIRNGNGAFVTTAGSNAGTGVVSPGNVIDSVKWGNPANSRDLTVRFHVNNAATPPVTTYDIVDNASNLSLLTGAAPAAGPYLRTYVPGAAISLSTTSPPDTTAMPFDYGAELSIEGAPASGDTFAVQASTGRDVFATVGDLLTVLQAGVNSSGASYAAYQNRLNGIMSNLDHALDNVLRVRASAGARLNEVDAAQGVSEDLGLHYSTRLSQLQDLDYAKALSELNLQQFYLEAAQKSFLRVTELGLFDYL